MASDRFRLKRLQASGWRGIGSALSIPLDQPLNVIYGPNGSGKSSILTAIEWALFPRETVRISDHGIGERRDWATRHVHGKDKPQVHLLLTRRGKDVEAGADSPVTARYADFKGLAFLHQETLRDFLIGAPAARQSAFQRLLGAGWAQDLAKAFDAAAKDLDADAVDERVASLEAQLHTRLLEARRQLGELEFDAAAAGLAPPWGEAEARLATEVAALKEAVPKPVPAAAATRRIRLEAGRAAWQAACERRDQTRDAAANAGEPAQFDARLRELTAERDRVSESLRALDRHAALLRDACAHIREHPEAAECPVCSQPAVAAALIVALESRLGASLSGEAESLRVRLAQVQADIVTTDRTRAEAMRLADAATRAQHDVERARQELAAEVGRAIMSAEDPAALAAQELARLEAEIAREAQAMQAAQARVTAFERASGKLSLARRVAEQSRRVAKLEALRQSPDWTAMLEAQRRIAVRELMLQHAAAAVKTHATALAAENLERARKPITNIYSQLTRRKDFPAVNVVPRDKFEVDVTSAAGGTVAATGVLNLTDLNCLALALTAGMAVAFPGAHDLDFLILDDPSQGMDREVTSRLAPILGHLAKRLQVVVATPDEALLEALRGQPVYKNIITLAPRDPADRAPQVRIAGVEQ